MIMKLNEVQKKIYEEIASGKLFILRRPRFRSWIPLPPHAKTINGLRFDKIIIDEWVGAPFDADFMTEDRGSGDKSVKLYWQYNRDTGEKIVVGEEVLD